MRVGEWWLHRRSKDRGELKRDAAELVQRDDVIAVRVIVNDTGTLWQLDYISAESGQTTP